MVTLTGTESRLTVLQGGEREQRLAFKDVQLQLRQKAVDMAKVGKFMLDIFANIILKTYCRLGVTRLIL